MWPPYTWTSRQRMSAGTRRKNKREVKLGLLCLAAFLISRLIFILILLSFSLFFFNSSYFFFLSSLLPLFIFLSFPLFILLSLPCFPSAILLSLSSSLPPNFLSASLILSFFLLFLFFFHSALSSATRCLSLPLSLVVYLKHLVRLPVLSWLLTPTPTSTGGGALWTTIPWRVPRMPSILWTCLTWEVNSSEWAGWVGRVKGNDEWAGWKVTMSGQGAR